jgi:hypothetical protein
MDGASLFWGLIFGAIGLGMFIYGRKQSRMVPFVCGLGLMVFPYFVSDLYMLIAAGAALLLAAYFIRI